MDQASVKGEDIVIQLTDDIAYNVSDVLRKHDSSEPEHKLMNYLNKFTQLLDSKVYIDTNDPRYSHIYQDIDTVVQRVIAELTKLDPYFAFVKLRRTGSSTSGVKVGLPHESDYVMELPKDKQLKSGQLFKTDTRFSLVQDIVATTSAVLTDGLPLWLIHGTESHHKIGGICLVMECRAHANDPASEKVGVSVDIVPVYIEDTTNESLNPKAKAFLPFSLDQYANKVELYRLLDESYCDTGFIENLLMKQLPDETKQLYRVAKLLLSHLNIHYDIPYGEIATLDEQKQLKLYGRLSYLSSYTFRVLFLHLLLHVHGTEAEQRLKRGLLVLILLDMVQKWMCRNARGPFTRINLRHPLIDNREQEHRGFIFYDMKPIDDLLQRLEKEDPVKIVDEFDMINTKCPQIEPYTEYTYACAGIGKNQ